MALTVEQLLVPATRQQVLDKLLAEMQANGFPITDWNVGGVDRTEMFAIAKGLLDLSANAIPTIVRGGYATQAATDWLTLLAHEWFLLDRNPATNTIGTIVLDCNGTSGPYTISDGQIIAVFPSGNRYINVGSGALPTSGSLSLSWRSEFPNNSLATPALNYVDPSGATIVLATPLPGVSARNPAPTYSDVTKTGSGTGTIGTGGSPTGSHQLTIRIDGSGAAGVATWSYSLDGAAFVSAGAVAGLTNIGGTGINATLVNGAGVPSFVAGDTYSFQTPGSWITTQGTDVETDVALLARCLGRWPSLSIEPTLGAYDLLARAASAQVTQTYVDTDPAINNRVRIYVAGQAGSLPGSVVASVQTYINKRVPITDNPIVGSPTQVAVSLSAATVQVSQSLLAGAKTAVQAAVQTYMNSVGLNGIVRLADLYEIIMAIAGVKNLYGLSISGANAANGVDLQLPTTGGAIQIVSWTQDLTTLWTWLGV